MSLVYKIASADEWRAAQESGRFTGAPVDLADGFIHFSTAEQARETAAKHFAGHDGLFLLALESSQLGDQLKWEPSRGGALFPHVYGTIATGLAASVTPLPLENGQHRFPEGIP